MTPGPPGKDGKGLAGKLGKRRGLVLFGAAAAGVAGFALLHKRSGAASSSPSYRAPASPAVYRAYGGGSQGGASFQAQIDNLLNLLRREERQITRLERRKKKKKKKKKRRGGPSGGSRHKLVPPPRRPGKRGPITEPVLPPPSGNYDRGGITQRRATWRP